MITQHLGHLEIVFYWLWLALRVGCVLLVSYHISSCFQKEDWRFDNYMWKFEDPCSPTYEPEELLEGLANTQDPCRIAPFWFLEGEIEEGNIKRNRKGERQDSPLTARLAGSSPETNGG